MPSKLVKNTIGQNSLSGPLEGLIERLNAEVLKVLREVRGLLNSMVDEYNAGAVTLGTPVGSGTASLMMRWGAGDPNVSFLTDPVGSVYFRSDGGAGTTLYVREPGGWVGK